MKKSSLRNVIFYNNSRLLRVPPECPLRYFLLIYKTLLFFMQHLLRCIKNVIFYRISNYRLIN